MRTVERRSIRCGILPYCELRASFGTVILSSAASEMCPSISLLTALDACDAGLGYRPILCGCDKGGVMTYDQNVKISICDVCGMSERFFVTVTSTMPQARPLPDEWEYIDHHELCPDCVHERRVEEVLI
jgi:hypothetical protein